MEQQLANREYFNMIAFGGEAFKQTMVKPTPANLQKAWSWVFDLQWAENRNFHSVFKVAV